MNTHETYCSLETAKLLKQAGFDWEINTHYFVKDGNVELKSDYRYLAKNYNASIATMDSLSFQFEIYSASTLSVAQKWLIEVKNIMVYVCPSFEPLEESDKWMLKYQVSAVHSDIEADIMDLSDIEEKCFDTYEEALEAGIKKCLTLILEKK